MYIQYIVYVYPVHEEINYDALEYFMYLAKFIAVLCLLQQFAGRFVS